MARRAAMRLFCGPCFSAEAADAGLGASRSAFRGRTGRSLLLFLAAGLFAVLATSLTANAALADDGVAVSEPATEVSTPATEPAGEPAPAAEPTPSEPQSAQSEPASASVAASEADADAASSLSDAGPSEEAPQETQASSIVTPAAGAPVELASGDVSNFAIAEDGQSVVYQQTAAGSTTIQSVNIGGGTSTLLSSGLTQPQSCRISPDSTAVAILADVGGETWLYTVLLGGGTLVNLSGAGFDAELPLFGAGGLLAFQRTDTTFLTTAESTPVFSPALTRIDDPAEGGLWGDVFGMSPNGLTVSYSASNIETLFTVPIGGGASSQMSNGAAAMLGSVFTEDSQRVVFDQFSSLGIALYSNLVGGGALVQLSDDVWQWDVAPNSQTVVFTQTGGPLFSRPVDGSSAATQLTATSATRPEVSDNSALVVFVNDVGVLSSVGIGGGAVTPLSSGTNPVGGIAITDDSATVVFTEVAGGVATLFSVPIGGGTPTPLSSGGNVSVFGVVGTTTVVFNEDGVLYQVAIGGGTPEPLSGAGGSVVQFRVSADGAYVVYRQNVSGDEDVLFSVALDGSPEPPTPPEPTPEPAPEPGSTATGSDTASSVTSDETAGSAVASALPFTGGHHLLLALVGLIALALGVMASVVTRAVSPAGSAG